MFIGSFGGAVVQFLNGECDGKSKDKIQGSFAALRMTT
jgi:hypothetical protein